MLKNSPIDEMDWIMLKLNCILIKISWQKLYAKLISEIFWNYTFCQLLCNSLQLGFNIFQSISSIGEHFDKLKSGFINFLKTNKQSERGLHIPKVEPKIYLKRFSTNLTNFVDQNQAEWAYEYTYIFKLCRLINE